MPKEQIVLTVEDSLDKAVLKFSSWEEAHNHIRMVILGGIIDELYELAGQDNPAEFKAKIEELRDIAKSINYPKDLEELKWAVEQWKEFGHGGTTIEIS